MYLGVSSDCEQLEDYQNDEGEFGLIERVSIRNIMCHDNLDISFAPNVNYVLGSNGSGKSAILTAIIVGLGGKVSTTGRGFNIKTIIKNGKQVAEIGVTLKNTGPDAIQPDVYGKSITIERKLTVDGKSSYKVKNGKGQVVSTKKSDLDSVLQAFNIQVSNPVAILTQENSRSFLNSKDSKDKYDFFHKATQLEQLEEEHMKTNQQRKMAQCSLQTKCEALPQLKREIMILEKKLKDHESLEQHRAKLVELENECVWALVIEKEKEAEVLGEDKSKMEAALKERKKRLRMLQEKYNDLVQKESNIQEHVTAAQNEIQSYKVKQREVNEETTGLKNQIRELKNKIKKHTNEVTLFEKELEMLTLNIEKSRQRSEEDLRKKEEERLRQINIHVKQKETLTGNFNALECKINELKETLEETKINHQSKSASFKSLMYKIQNFEKELDQMKKYQSNRVMAYGPDMPRLIKKVNELDQQRVFRCSPIGPVGLRVKIKDPKWTLAIERCLGSRLRSFLCDNMADAEKMQEVIQELGVQRPPSVICSKFINKVYDVRNNEVKSQKFCSVLQMLRDTEPIVLNHLIDERSIENILLIESNQEARQVLINQNTVPQRCYEAYTSLGNNLCPAPNFAFYSNRYKHPTLLSSSAYSKDDIKLKMDELKKLKCFQQQDKKDLDQLDRDISSQNKVLAQKGLELSKLQRQIIQEDAELKELENIEESNDVVFLEDELTKVDMTLKAVMDQKKQAEESIHQVFQEIVLNEEKMREFSNQCAIKDAEITNYMKLSLRTSGLSSMDVQREKDQLENICNEILKKFEFFKKAYARAQEIARERSSLAETMCPRVDTCRKAEVIQNLIEQRKEILNRNDGFTCIEEVMLIYKKKKSEYELLEQNIKEVKQNLKNLKHLLAQRLERFKTIRNLIALRVKYLFTANLDSQGFAGKLIFDHENRSMKIEVQATNREKPSSFSTKTLSGGEHSFITVILMLSLWDAVEIPFRILDEYDVCMDQINRKCSMDLMLETVLMQKGNQFIFLSPLELVPTKHMNKINILHMKDPIRHLVNQQDEEDSTQ